METTKKIAKYYLDFPTIWESTQRKKSPKASMEGDSDQKLSNRTLPTILPRKPNHENVTHRKPQHANERPNASKLNLNMDEAMEPMTKENSAHTVNPQHLKNGCSESRFQEIYPTQPTSKREHDGSQSESIINTQKDCQKYNCRQNRHYIIVKYETNRRKHMAMCPKTKKIYQIRNGEIAEEIILQGVTFEEVWQELTDTESTKENQSAPQLNMMRKNPHASDTESDEAEEKKQKLSNTNKTTELRDTTENRTSCIYQPVDIAGEVLQKLSIINSQSKEEIPEVQNKEKIENNLLDASYYNSENYWTKTQIDTVQPTIGKRSQYTNTVQATRDASSFQNQLQNNSQEGQHQHSNLQFQSPRDRRPQFAGTVQATRNASPVQNQLQVKSQEGPYGTQHQQLNQHVQSPRNPNTSPLPSNYHGTQYQQTSGQYWADLSGQDYLQYKRNFQITHPGRSNPEYLPHNKQENSNGYNNSCMSSRNPHNYSNTYPDQQIFMQQPAYQINDKEKHGLPPLNHYHPVPPYNNNPFETHWDNIQGDSTHGTSHRDQRMQRNVVRTEPHCNGDNLNWQKFPEIVCLPKPEALLKLLTENEDADPNELLKREYGLYLTMYNARDLNITWAERALTERRKELYHRNIKEIKDLNEHMEKSHKKFLQILIEVTSKPQDDPEDDIPLPIFGETSRIDMTNLMILPKFSGTEESLTLYQFWLKIMEYVTSQGISENGTKTILGLQLRGEALNIYLRNQFRSVKEIICRLKDQFESFPTIEDFEDQLEEFERQENEAITSTMNRFAYIIRNRYKDDKNLKRILEQTCKEKVRQVADPNAREELDRKEDEARQRGSEFTYQDRLKLIQREEKICKIIKQIPATEM